MASGSTPSNVVGVHYRVGKKIGEGSFGVIFEGTNLLNQQQVAIKFEPRKSDAPQLRDEYRTYKILVGCRKSSPVPPNRACAWACPALSSSLRAFNMPWRVRLSCFHVDVDETDTSTYRGSRLQKASSRLDGNAHGCHHHRTPMTCSHPSPTSDNDNTHTNVQTAGIPNVYYFGQEGLHNILVIDLLGPSLEDLFDHCNRKFTIKTVVMVAKQMVS